MEQAFLMYLSFRGRRSLTWESVPYGRAMLAPTMTEGKRYRVGQGTNDTLKVWCELASAITQLPIDIVGK